MTPLTSNMIIALVPEILLFFLLGAIVLYSFSRFSDSPISFLRSVIFFFIFAPFMMAVDELSTPIVQLGTVFSWILVFFLQFLVGVIFARLFLKFPIGKSCLILGIVLAFLYAAHFPLNTVLSIDDTLDPLAQEALGRSNAERSPGENLFLALLGLNGFQNEDPLALGKKIVESHDTSVRDAVANKSLEQLSALADSKDIIRSPRIDFSGYETDEITALELSSPKDVHLLQQIYLQNPQIINRYKQLRFYSRYVNPMIPSFVQPSINVFNLLRLNRVVLGKAFFDVSSGRHEVALREIEGEIRLYLLVQENATNLVNQMIAGALLKHTILAYQNLLDNPLFVQAGQFLDEEILRLSDDATSLARGVRYEYQLTAQIAQCFDESARRIAKPNMTANLASKVYLDIERNMGLPPQEILIWLSDDYRSYKESVSDIVRNPVGITIVRDTVEKIDFLKYRLQSIDLDVLFRLTRMKQLIRARNLSSDAIGDFVVKVPVSLNDPYSNDPYSLKAFQWDASSRRLYCERKGNVRENIISVEIPDIEARESASHSTGGL